MDGKAHGNLTWDAATGAGDEQKLIKEEAAACVIDRSQGNWF